MKGLIILFLFSFYSTQSSVLMGVGNKLKISSNPDGKIKQSLSSEKKYGSKNYNKHLDINNAEDNVSTFDYNTVLNTLKHHRKRKSYLSYAAENLKQNKLSEGLDKNKQKISENQVKQRAPPAKNYRSDEYEEDDEDYLDISKDESLNHEFQPRKEENERDDDEDRRTRDSEKASRNTNRKGVRESEEDDRDVKDFEYVDEDKNYDFSFIGDLWKRKLEFVRSLLFGATDVASFFVNKLRENVDDLRTPAKASKSKGALSLNKKPKSATEYQKKAKLRETKRERQQPNFLQRLARIFE